MTAKKEDKTEKTLKLATTGRHPIQVVARRTGLSAEVIRMWEKRYGEIVPDRTPTGRRMYSDEDLERLRLLREATLAGRRISEVSGLPTAELRSMILEDVRTPASVPALSTGKDEIETEAFIHRCFSAIRDLDPASLQSEVMRAFSSLSGEVFVEDLLAPLFRRIGEEWEAGRLDSYHEHMGSSVIKTILLNILSTQQTGSRVIVLATPSGQHHEVGIALAAVVAATSGWRVVYLGTDLPAADIVKAAKQSRARMVALSIVYPTEGTNLKQELRELSQLLSPQTSLLVGGQGIGNLTKTLSDIGALTMSNYRELREVLRSISDAQLSVDT